MHLKNGALANIKIVNRVDGPLAHTHTHNAGLLLENSIIHQQYRLFQPNSLYSKIIMPNNWHFEIQSNSN